MKQLTPAVALLLLLLPDFSFFLSAFPPSDGNMCPPIVFFETSLEDALNCNDGKIWYQFQIENNDNLIGFEYGARIVPGGDWSFQPYDPNDEFNTWAENTFNLSAGEYTWEMGIRDPSTGEITVCETRNISLNGFVDEFPPQLNCDTGPITVDIGSGPVNLDVSVPVPTDDCSVGGSDAFHSKPDGSSDSYGDLTSLQNPLPIVIDQAGQHEILWRAWDFAGGITECRTVIMANGEDACMDTDVPSVDCFASLTESLINGMVTIDIPLPTASDDCGVTSLVLWAWDFVLQDWIISGEDVTQLSNPFQYTFTAAGSYDFVWFARDESGKEGSCNTMITIQEEDECSNDTENPQITCHPHTTVQLVNGQASIDLTLPTGTDNCGIVNQSVSIDAASFSLELNVAGLPDPYTYSFTEPGETRFTWRAFDAAGNGTHCATIITVTEEPVGGLSIQTKHPSTCSANDGQVRIGNVLSQCSDMEFIRVMLNGSEWITPNGPMMTDTIILNNAGPGNYVFQLGTEDPATGAVTPCGDPVDVTLVPQRDDYTGPTIDCKDMVMDTLDENGEATLTIDHPAISAGCGRSIVSSDAYLIYPDGSDQFLGDLDAINNPLDLAFNSVGTYQIQWRALDSDDNFVSCTTIIVIKPNEPGVGTSQLCGDPSAFVSASDCNAGATSIPIEIAGVGNISSSNGLVEVYIEANVPNNFTGSIWLDAPSGERIALALSTEGSYSTYNGSISGGSMRWFVLDCPNVQPHNSTAVTNWFDILGFQPYQSFKDLNNTGLDADGTWNLTICNNDISQSFDVTCARLRFAPVCPQIGEMTATPATCLGNDGSITVTSTMNGYCSQNLFYSINGTSWQTDPTFADLSAGEYSIYITNDPDGDCISFKNITVSNDGDFETPQFMDCPADQTVEVGDQNRISVVITEPTSSDDCAVILDTLIICDPSGDLTGFQVSPGTSRNWILSPGQWAFKWIAFDATGKFSSCVTTITVTEGCEQDREAPVIENCPNDTILVLTSDSVQISIRDPRATDNCSLNDTLIFVRLTDTVGDNVYPDSLFEYTFTSVGKRQFYWIFYDDAGNADTCTMMITVIEEPDSCTFNRTPPVITNCPDDQTIDVSSGSSASWSITEPGYSDDCGIASATLRIMNSIGQSSSTNAEPGNVLSGEDNLPGKYMYTWTVRDSAGNTATCKTTIDLICPVECEQPLWFMADNCSPASDPLFAGPCKSSNEAVLNIDVDGIGVLTPELGLMEVEIIAWQQKSFTGEFWLKDPAGNWYLLAAAREGSFPNYPQSYPRELRASFRYCSALAESTEDLSNGDLACAPVQPIDNILLANVGNVNADGIWQVIACNNDETDTLTVSCAKLHFGRLCPEITDYHVLHPDCSDGTGAIIIDDFNEGYCVEDGIGYAIEIDDQTFVQESGEFYSLPPGDYNVTIGYLGSQGDLYCTTTMAITVPELADVNPPVLENCPKDIIYSLRYEDSITLTIPAPLYYDDCPIFPATLYIIRPYDGFNGQDTVSVIFTSEEMIDIRLDRCGEYCLLWEVSDFSGNTTSCKTNITVTDDPLSEYCADICLDEEPVVVPYCGDNCVLDIPIEVYGIDIMEADYSLRSVVIEGNFLRKYTGNIQLISPQGFSYWLSSPEVGSFPTFTGDQGGVPFDVTYTRCAPGLQHDDRSVAPDEIPGNTFSPIDNWHGLYAYEVFGEGKSADGTWKLRVCNTDRSEKFTIDCVRLRFGPIRPRIVDYAVGAAGCTPDTLGSFEVITLEPGSCPEYGIVYSLDQENWQEEGSFDNLVAGDYTAYVAYTNIADITGRVSYIFRNSVDFTVKNEGDQEAPQLWNCPKLTVVNLGETNELKVIEPAYSDDCEVVSSQLRVVNFNTDEVLEEREIQPGQLTTWLVNEPVLLDMYWEVTDALGQTTRCLSLVDVLSSQAVQPEEEVEVQTPNLDHLSVRPTVTSDEFEIQAQFESSHGKTLRLLDAQGQLILEQDFGRSQFINERISIANKPAGLYFITIQDGSKIHTARVIKQ